ncbi:hypothetical protein E4K73_50570 [Streptomyces sp. IB201691-2A2]|nr:hypothetical protein E4K73_50570 [Streptomyces sp. IB201691-2A2]
MTTAATQQPPAVLRRCRVAGDGVRPEAGQPIPHRPGPACAGPRPGHRPRHRLSSYTAKHWHAQLSQLTGTHRGYQALASGRRRP